MSTVAFNADLVWDELVLNPAGLTMYEIIANTGLSKWQVIPALRQINHELQETKGQPLAVSRVYTGGTGRPAHLYLLPKRWQEQRPWSSERLADLLTRAKTESVRARASEARWPKAVPSFLAHSLDRLVNDIEFALSLL